MAKTVKVVKDDVRKISALLEDAFDLYCEAMGVEIKWGVKEMDDVTWVWVEYYYDGEWKHGWDAWSFNFGGYGKCIVREIYCDRVEEVDEVEFEFEYDEDGETVCEWVAKGILVLVLRREVLGYEGLVVRDMLRELDEKLRGCKFAKKLGKYYHFP